MSMNPMASADSADSADSAEQEHVRESTREGVTMGLYVGLSLLAVVLAQPLSRNDNRLEIAAVVFFTAIALLIAHMLAFSISSRLVSQGELDAKSRQIIGQQVLGGLTVTVVATVPLLLFPPHIGTWVTPILLVALVAGAGFVAARQAHVSNLRVIVYVALVVAITALILGIKAFVH